jgi:hypothetical protein
MAGIDFQYGFEVATRTVSLPTLGSISPPFQERHDLLLRGNRRGVIDRQ